MNYRRFEPHPAIGPFVEAFWLQEAPASESVILPTRVVPTCGFELVVCFGAPFEQVDDTGVGTRMPMALAAGQRSRRIDVRATGETGLVIARCYPWTAGGLLGEGAKHLTDRSVQLDHVAEHADARFLAERVATAATGEERVRLVEQFLLGWLDGVSSDPIVVTAVQTIARRSGRIKVRKLAEGFGLGERQLRRRFVASTGVGPKQLARLARFQAALGGLRRGHRWEDVVWAGGYSDQAHLIHEIGEFLGLSPGKIVRRPTTPLKSFFNSERSALSTTLNTTSYV